MRLHEVLATVLQLVGDIGCDHVTIARDGDPTKIQIRFAPNKVAKHGYSVAARRWMFGTEETPMRGTVKGHIGWCLWSRFLGFSIEQTIATDWRIL